MSRPNLISRVACATVLVLAAACGGGGGEGKTPEPAADPAAASRPCKNEIPFDAAYLPPGFSKRLESGPGAGKPSIKNVAAFHYSGGSGKWVDIFRGGFRNKLTPPLRPIKVIGRFGRIAKIPGNGYGIRFRFGTPRCSLYQVEVFGVSSAEAVKVGHGLRPKQS
jgi:hypothetical protein